VVPYFASDLKDSERITHVIKMTQNEVVKKQAAGFYRDIELTESDSEPMMSEKIKSIRRNQENGR
jgi:hypothetical protein